MPELPEVETVRRGLEPALTGAHLSQVAIMRPDIRFPFPAFATCVAESVKPAQSEEEQRAIFRGLR